MTQPRPRRRLVARYIPGTESNPYPTFHLCANCPTFSRYPDSKVWKGEYHERSLCFTCLHIITTGNCSPFILPPLHNPYRLR